MLYRLVCTVCLLTSVGLAQNSAAVPPPSPLSFATASVTRSREMGRGVANMPLDLSSAYAATNGRFYAHNFNLFSYIAFAYALTPPQRNALRNQLPSWISVERFDIDAQAANPLATKDDMRRMMRSLLADKFHLAMHTVMRTGPVYALELITPGKPGPGLSPHQPGSCAAAVASGRRASCGFVVNDRLQYGYRLAGRDVPISLVADNLSCFEEARPIVDQTGLTGRYDVKLVYSMRVVRRNPGAIIGGIAGGSPGEVTDNNAGEQATSNGFAELETLSASNPDPLDEQHEPPLLDKALKAQLGMKLVKQRGQFEIWVLDQLDKLPKS